MRIVAKSDIGTVRELDEDSVSFIHTEEIYEGKSREKALLILADGMGGHSAGEIASRIAMDSVKKVLFPLMIEKEDISEKNEIRNKITDAYSTAERNIRAWAKQNSVPSMGTTLVISYIDGERAFFGNVGDSRAYILSENEVIRITYDDSLVFTLAEEGKIRFDEMKKHPQKNIITKAIGPVSFEKPQISRYMLKKGDIILLCCDGLWEMLDDLEIFSIIRSCSPNIEKAANELLELALARGADDNVSFIICQK